MKKIITVFIIITAIAIGIILFRSQNNKETLAASPRTGLVGYWTMDANDIKTMTAQGVVYDRSGLGSYATSRLTPRLVAGKIGQGFVFDGSTEITTSTLTQSITGDATIAGWIKYTTSGGQYRALDLAQANTLGMQITVASGNIVTDNSGGPTSGITDAVLTNDSKWHFAVFTRQGTTYTLYVDGRTIGTSGGTAPTYTKVYIGGVGSPVNGAPSFPGSIDDVRIYNRALSAAEVANLYTSSARNYSASAPRTGVGGQLVGYWTMDANDINGTAIYDKSGNSLTGTSANAPTIVAGKIKQGMNFNGTTDRVTVSGNALLNSVSSTSVSAWVKIAALPVTFGGTIATKGNYSFYTEISTTGKLQVYLTNTTPTGYKAGNSTLPLNQWVNVAWTYDGNTQLNVYVNGKNDGTFTLAGALATSNNVLSIGSLGGSGYQFTGSIDDVRVYNYALSAQEVANLYNSSARTVTAAPPRTGLVGWWKMDNNDYNPTTKAVLDRSGQNNTGTSANAATFVSGKIAQAMSFNGTSDYVTGSGTNLPNVGDNAKVTISAWIKPTTLDVRNVIFNKGQDGVAFNYGMLLLNGTLRARNSNADYSLVGTVSTGVWQHVVVVYDGTLGAIGYINGINVGSNASAITTTAVNTNWAIGRRSYDTSSEYFNGSIDDVRIYNRALSATEVTALYQSSVRTYK